MTDRCPDVPSPLWVLAPAAAAPLVLGVSSPLWRVAAGLVLVAFLPGRLLLGLLGTYRPLPSRWRTALVIPTGLALTVLVLLALEYSGRYEPRRAVALLILGEEALALAWIWRGRGPPAGIALPSIPRRPSSVALFTAILVFLGAVTYATLTPRRAVSLTEFYLVDPDGRLPLAASEEDVRVVVVNHEGRPVHYRVVGRGTTAHGVISLHTAEVALAGGRRWEWTWTMPAWPRLRTATWSLFREGDERPYRRLSIALAGALADDLKQAAGQDGKKHNGQGHDDGPQDPVDLPRPGRPDRRYQFAGGE